MIQHPIIRNDARIELAHQTLPDVIDAVLVMPLVQLRYAVGLLTDFGEVAHVVVLPDVVQAVQLVGADGRGDVAATGFGGELGGCAVVADFEDVFFRDADEAVCGLVVVSLVVVSLVVVSLLFRDY